MRKIYLCCFVLFLVLAAPIFTAASSSEPQNQNTASSTASTLDSSAAAKPASTVQNPAEKLSRGIVNIITSPIEIAKQVDLGWKRSTANKQNASVGIFSGLCKGLVYTVGRMGSGAWDVLTFPFKNSAGTYEPLMKPEFVLDK